MDFRLDELLTVTFTLFAVIDVVGSVPLLISLKEKIGGIRSLQATWVSGAVNDPVPVCRQTFFEIIGIRHPFFCGWWFSGHFFAGFGNGAWPRNIQRR
jgi:hypothetical protein